MSVYTNDIDPKICTQEEFKGQTVLTLLIMSLENGNRRMSYSLTLIGLRVAEKAKTLNFSLFPIPQYGLG